MDYNQAVALLGDSVRSECRDHAFGDREVFWDKDGKTVAEGYFGGGESSVTLENTFTFKGEEAISLSKLGRVGSIDRNDSTGPSQYVDGQTMPGLTLEGVRRELEF